MFYSLNRDTEAEVTAGITATSASFVRHRDRPTDTFCQTLMKGILQSVQRTVEEDVDAVLVGQRLHGHAHLLKLLVGGVRGVPAAWWQQCISDTCLCAPASHQRCCDPSDAPLHITRARALYVNCAPGFRLDDFSSSTVRRCGPPMLWTHSGA